MPDHALVTGGATRLGKAIAIFLAEQGYDIALHYHKSTADATVTAAAIADKGRQCQLYQADLSNTASIHTLAEQLPPLTLLINNASAFLPDAFGTIDSTLAQHHWHINTLAPLLLSEHFARQSTRANNQQIIHILDEKVQAPDNCNFFSYTLSKCALAASIPMVARHLAPHIRVNGIAPGPVIQGVRESDEHFVAHCHNRPLHHSATIADVLRTLQYLINTPCITGHVIPLDGGKFTH